MTDDATRSDTTPETLAKRKAADRERKRLSAERQQRMRGASQRWTQHVRNALMRKGKR